MPAAKHLHIPDTWKKDAPHDNMKQTSYCNDYKYTTPASPPHDVTDEKTRRPRAEKQAQLGVNIFRMPSA